MTTKQMAEIKQRNLAGENDREIAEAMGLHKKTVNNYRNMMGLKSNGKRGGIYFVYKKKTDELVVCGTAKECAAFLGCKLESFRSYMSRIKNEKRPIYTVVKEEDDDGAGAEGDM